MRLGQNLPFLKILVPYILGVFTAIYWAVQWYYLPCIILSFFAVIKLLEHIKNKRLKVLPYHSLGVLIALSFILLGFVRVNTYRDINKPNHFKNFEARFFKIKVIDFAEPKFGNYRFKAEVQEVASINKDTVYPTSGNVLVYWDAALSEIPTLGKCYWLGTKLQSIPGPKNPNEFNYKEYLTYYNIYYKTYVRSNNLWVASDDKVGKVDKNIIALRQNVNSIFEKYLVNKQTLLVAQALILGGKNNLDAETKEYFAHTGTLHVLAVSGLHVGIIFLILGALTKLLLKLKNGKYIRVIMLILGIWVYALMTGFSPSVQRASLMFSLLSLGDLSKSKTTGLNSLFGSAFLMLAYNPFLIVNVGFQLSYAAVLGIMLIYKPVYQVLSFSFISNKYVWYWVDKAWSICAISFAAQLATFPISVFYFGQFPIYFLFSNLVVIPIIFLMVCAAVGIVFFCFIPLVAKLFAFTFHCLAIVVLSAVEYVAKLPYAFADGLYLNFWQVLWLYLIIGLLIAWMHIRKLRDLNLSLGALVVLLLVINISYISKNETDKTVLHSIRNSIVITRIQGNQAFIIADSAFVANQDAQKFHLDPYFRSNYVKNITLKTITNKLVGIRRDSSLLTLITYNTKYPNLKDFQSDNVYWLLSRNSYTDTISFKALNNKVIWEKHNPYYPIKETNHPYLDSFAIIVK